MTTRYRSGLHDDLPATRAYDDIPHLRRKSAEKNARLEVANALIEQGAIDDVELDRLLKIDVNAYWERVGEIERRRRAPC